MLLEDAAIRIAAQSPAMDKPTTPPCAILITNGSMSVAPTRAARTRTPVWPNAKRIAAVTTEMRTKIAAKVIAAGTCSGLIAVLLALVAEIVISLRRGDIGVDIVAALSMLAALVFSEDPPAVVVALMYAGGQYLEDLAERRASREMTALLARVPHTAVRQRNGRLEEVDLDVIEPGDRLVVRKGDVVPVDGAVIEGLAVLDQ